MNILFDFKVNFFSLFKKSHKGEFPCTFGIMNGYFIHAGPLLERGWSFYLYEFPCRPHAY